MGNFLAFLGWLIIFGSIYTEDFKPHDFYRHLFQPASMVEEAIKNPPDMTNRKLLIPNEFEGDKENLSEMDDQKEVSEE